MAQTRMPPTIVDLPVELCTMIFLESWIDSPGVVLPGPIVASTPTCISMVCRQWRQIALSTPALWSIYDITCSYKTGDEEARRVVLYLLPFIARAGTREISIKTKCSDVWMSPLLEIIPGAAGIGAASLAVAIGGFSDLEDYDYDDLAIPTYYGNFVLRLGPSDASAIPRLRRLVLSSTGFGHFFGWPMADFAHWRRLPRQLTIFRASTVRMSMADSVRILRACPLLEEGAFTLDDSSSPLPIKRKGPDILHPLRLHLPNLKTLHVAFLELDCSFWDVLTVPNLLHLSISVDSHQLGDRDDWLPSDAPFTALLQRSVPPLTTLALHFDFTGYPAEWLAILARLPTLEALTVRFYVPWGPPDAGLCAFADGLCIGPPRSGPPLVPRLRTLRMDTNADMVRMALSRAGGTAHQAGCHLTHVTLYAAGPALITDAIARLERRGVNVAVENIAFFGGLRLECGIDCFDFEVPQEFVDSCKAPCVHCMY
ncbi:hypothetical protein B0H15DRAFT_289505 [Mycena belliarum]|uniref:F-box domain-containing protein n=1 Tax=Mycena belliarum TaxID=1033014 RepID=A0AAD6U8A2_9AGAR|nr:hypothetical protein B0H15DRAFT_289505 [Mycena belliae]